MKLGEKIVVTVSFLATVLGIAYIAFEVKKKKKTPDYQDLSAYDLHGKKIRLNNFQGKILVVDFWATWCVPCRDAALVVDKLYQKAPPDKFQFYGVNTDHNKTLKEISDAASDFGMNYETLLDSQLVLAKKWAVEGLPTLIVFNREGKIIYRQMGIRPEEYPLLLRRMQDWENE